MAGTLQYSDFESVAITSSASNQTHITDNEINGYVIVKEVSSDSASVCYLCEKESNLYYLKQYKKTINDTLRKLFDKLESIHSLYLAEIVESFDTDDGFVEVQKYYGDITLESYCGNINIHSVINDLNKGLADLHKSNILHNDIKPNNVIVFEDRCIITDFDNISAGAGIISRYTIEYAAPEVISTGFVSTSSDYYSLGITIYELVTGHNPFKSLNSYDCMNIKNQGRWIVGDALPDELKTLITGLCDSNNSSRWQFTETDKWIKKNGNQYDLSSFSIGKQSSEIGSIYWNGQEYDRQQLSSFISDLGRNWNNGVEFLMSGHHDKEIRMYSPELAYAMDNEIHLFTDEVGGKSFKEILSGYEDGIIDAAFFNILIKCGIEFQGVFWRGFVGSNVQQLALKMLNDCFSQYYSASEFSGTISQNSFAGSAIAYHVISSYCSFASDVKDDKDGYISRVRNYEKEYLSGSQNKSLEAAFSLCYLVSGSKEYPLLSNRNISSLDMLHTLVKDALNQSNQYSVLQIISRCSNNNVLNVPFKIWLSNVAK